MELRKMKKYEFDEKTKREVLRELSNMYFLRKKMKCSRCGRYYDGQFCIHCGGIALGIIKRS
jgi:hypothetical protein